MRTSSQLILIGLAFALGAGAMWLATRPGVPATTTDAAQAQKKILYWYDPMVPQQHFDAPGRSPHMDMPLVPKYADVAAVQGTVSIDARQVQNLGIRTAKAQRGILAHTVRATGVLAFDERAISVVQSRVAGIVAALRVRAPLTRVQAGGPLLTLIAPDWTAAEEDYLSLRRARSPGLDALRAAARQRLLLLGMDAAQIDALERSGKAATQFVLAAPRSGVITDLSVREGASVAAGAPLMTLSGLDEVWMNAAIPEVDSRRVEPRARATATLSAYPGEAFAGAVETVLPEVDAATRTQIARIVLPNPQHRLAPGMYASIEIAAPDAPESVLVPSEAVIATGVRRVVIVAEGQGRFHAQEVRTGAEANGKTAILEGLHEGDSVVLSGQFLIDSEASLTGALRRLGDKAMPTGHVHPAAENEP